MKTKERVLLAAQEMMKEQGIASVTTNALADAAEISVGNLYYHFHNKEDIVLTLLRAFSQQMRTKPLSSSDSLVNWVDWWFGWFSAVEQSLFLFQDQRYLNHCNDHVAFEYRALMHFVEKQQQQFLISQKQQSTLIATFNDIDRLAKQLMFVGFFWPEFHHLQHRSEGQGTALTEALAQCLSLLLPYLTVEAQMSIEAQIKSFQ